MSKQTTISVSPETLATWNELSERTRIPISTLIKDITESIQKQLDLLQAGKRLLFMADFYNRDNVPKTIVRLSDANSFCIPPELDRKEVLKAFNYDENFNELKPTEQPQQQPTTEQPKRKLSFTEQIQAKHDEDVRREQQGEN